MDEQKQDSYGSFSQANASSEIPAQLRPLSTGELLDRTFALYRRHFWLFLAIAMLPAGTVAATSAARMIYEALTHRAITVSQGMSPDAIAQSMNTLLLTQGYFLPAVVIFVIVYGLSQAAAVYAVGEMARGQRIAAGEAYRAIRKRWLRWTGIALRWGWSLVWPMAPVLIVLTFALAFARGNTLLVGTITLLFTTLLPASLVFGFINFLRNALAMPVGVIEDTGVNAAMRRSKTLVAGRKGRIFLTLLLIYALQTVAGGLQLPFVLLAAASRGAEHIVLQTAQLLISFVGTALVTPVASIALTLLYVDERIRREGYDIEVLMQHSFGMSAGGLPPSQQKVPTA